LSNAVDISREAIDTVEQLLVCYNTELYTAMKVLHYNQPML